jgi:hypothetical protein
MIDRDAIQSIVRWGTRAAALNELTSRGNPRAKKRNPRRRNARAYIDPDSLSHEDVLSDDDYEPDQKRPSVERARSALRETAYERDRGAWFYGDEPKHPRVPKGSRIQSLIFAKSHFTVRTAHQWALAHGFKATKADVTANTIRVRQLSPATVTVVGTITLRPGVQATVAR